MKYIYFLDNNLSPLNLDCIIYTKFVFSFNKANNHLGFSKVSAQNFTPVSMYKLKKNVALLIKCIFMGLFNTKCNVLFFKQVFCKKSNKNL